MLLDTIIPGATFQLSPDGAQVFWVVFFGVVIALAAVGAPRKKQ